MFNFGRNRQTVFLSTVTVSYSLHPRQQRMRVPDAPHQSLPFLLSFMLVFDMWPCIIRASYLSLHLSFLRTAVVPQLALHAPVQPSLELALSKSVQNRIKWNPVREAGTLGILYRRPSGPTKSI